MTTRETASAQPSSEIAESLRRGVLIGAAVLVLVLPPAVHYAPRYARNSPAVQPQAGERRLADLGAERVSADVRRMANWIATSRDNGLRAFAILDKPRARVYLFGPDGRLGAAATALLGSARGDDTFPGVGDKPLKEVQPEEKTTPAGRFIAQVGQSSTRGEDVVWIDYDAAVSMHRIIKVPERLKAMATPDLDDNRMSFGCVNLPDAFYEGQLRPAIDRWGLVVYVLPETRPIEQTFVSFYDVDAPATAPPNTAQH